MRLWTLQLAMIAAAFLAGWSALNAPRSNDLKRRMAHICTKSTADEIDQEMCAQWLPAQSK